MSSESPTAESCTVVEHAYLAGDLAEERAERDAMRTELKNLRAKFATWVRRLGVDPEDEKAMQVLKEDLLAYVRHCGRRRSGHLRASDESPNGTQAHLEGVLARKRDEIRRLSRENAELRAQVDEARGWYAAAAPEIVVGALAAARAGNSHPVPAPPAWLQHGAQAGGEASDAR